MDLQEYGRSLADALEDACDAAERNALALLRAGTPPCLFCRREVPCECAGEECMCSCGRCMAEPLPVYQADSPPS